MPRPVSKVYANIGPTFEAAQTYLEVARANLPLEAPKDHEVQELMCAFQFGLGGYIDAAILALQTAAVARDTPLTLQNIIAPLAAGISTALEAHHFPNEVYEAMGEMMLRGAEEIAERRPDTPTLPVGNA